MPTKHTAVARITFRGPLAILAHTLLKLGLITLYIDEVVIEEQGE